MEDVPKTSVRTSGSAASSMVRLPNLSAQILAGKAFLIKTSPAIQLYQRLEEWLTVGFLGGVVSGHPRLGKTCATRWVLGALNQTVGCVPWIEIPVRRGDLPSDHRAFFGYILRCLRNRYARIGTVSDKQDRLTEALNHRARISAIRTVVLFFDEAQYLTLSHYLDLITITNELDPFGYRAFCLFVGQERLKAKADSITAEGYDEVAGRFFIGRWEFQAISSLPETTECMQQYDAACYPTQNGKPFASWFVPEAWARGFRLESLDEIFWAAFSTAARGGDAKGLIMIPMHYLSSAVVLLLNTLARRDSPLLQVVMADVEDAVRRCGYLQALKQPFDNSKK